MSKNRMTPVEAVNVIEKKLFDNRAKPYTEEDAQIDNAWDIIKLRLDLTDEEFNIIFGEKY